MSCPCRTARRSTPMVPAAQGRSHRWYTSVNHHLAHDTMVALLDGAEREHASPRSPTIASVELATARSCVSPWWSSPSPTGGSAQEVAGEADARLGHAAALLDCLAGRSALPLDPGDGGHRGMPQGHQGQATEPTKSARQDQPPTMGRLRSRVGWWSACGWGSGMPAPSGQLPPPWTWRENEAPATRAARRPVPGSSRRAPLCQVGCHRWSVRR
jgi:hypothetical protein